MLAAQLDKDRTTNLSLQVMKVGLFVSLVRSLLPLLTTNLSLQLAIEQMSEQATSALEQERSRLSQEHARLERMQRFFVLKQMFYVLYVLTFIWWMCYGTDF
jgi:hypothetical protein